MITYFADRKMNIIGQASTELPNGLIISEDLKVEDVETGVASFECTIPFSDETNDLARSCTKVGNYILRKDGRDNEFYTIIDVEISTKKREISIYAEDAGLDLLNEMVGALEADKAYPVKWYVDKFTVDSGFEIGINEIPNLTRKLSWDGEATATERLASVATQFDNAEIGYSFDVKGLEITRKYINIYKKRGKDVDVQLRLNYEIDNIVTSESIANLATSLRCIGGTPEGSDNPITLKGYKYDDGDLHISGDQLQSRSALAQWSRYVWNKEPNKLNGQVGHIVRNYSYDTTSQSELCNRAVTELKKVSQIEVNYEVDITVMPENVRIGDRVNIVDDNNELYLNARVLKLETSVVDDKKTATIGEYLIRSSGISQKVADLAEAFAKNSASAERAKELANSALQKAQTAQNVADEALEGSEGARQLADEAQQAAQNAVQSAGEANTKADSAVEAVGTVEESVKGLENTVQSAQDAADYAKEAAETAQRKAEEAHQSALVAKGQAEKAESAAGVAGQKADSAVEKSETAQSTADAAKQQAEKASTSAEAAKLDAQAAQEEIDSLGDSLTTLSDTMQAEYARKTELTEARADLQTKIERNATGIASTATKVQEIDETANNAAALAGSAQQTASQAQEEAKQAASDAAASQTAADAAKKAADTAQAEADNAKKAAATAQSVADKAETDLATAKADLATVQGRVDATESDILEAQRKVTEAQAAADKAKADALSANTKADTAQNKANQAVEDAANAQTTANTAASNALNAQKLAEDAKGAAEEAQKIADTARETASEAQRTADTAKENAAAAQSNANSAKAQAQAAEAAAKAADTKAQQAAQDLATAEQNLANVTSRVDATEEEVAAAQAQVEAAKQSAQKAAQDAAKAQTTADTAKLNANAAQTAATNAKKAADEAQSAADEAQKAADKAQQDVNSLAVRVTSAETKIDQNSEKIQLSATKEEVTKTLGGYYTKTEADTLLRLESEGIKTSVSKTYATKQEVDDIEIGGRNLLLKTGEVDSPEAPWSINDDGNLECTDPTSVCQSFKISNVEDVRGKRVVLSFEYFADEGLQWGTTNPWLGMEIPVQFVDASVSAQYISARITKGQLVTSKWTRVAIIQTVKDAELKTPAYACTYHRDVTGRVAFRHFKLELGSKATDWTPAPEDTDEAISENRELAENANALSNANDERLTISESMVEQLANSLATLIVDENGASAMEQTSKGWQFNIGEMRSTLEKAAGELNNLSGTMDEAKQTIGHVSDLVNDLSKKTAYITMTTDDTGAPCIELGKADNDFKVRITNTSIDFMEGTSRVAYFNNESMYISRAVIEDEIQIGEGDGFIWKRRSNGNMGLRWVGGGK